MKTSLEPFYSELSKLCEQIVQMEGDRVKVRTESTSYVIDGKTTTITLNNDETFSFWLGVNWPRLIFISYVSSNLERTKEIFRFTFGGAAKVGWDINYEPIDDGTSIWATCYLDRARPLVNGSTLSEEGHFWATDIAMMVQSWVRTCERFNLKRHPKDPAPL